MITETNIAASPARFSFYKQAEQITLQNERRYSFLFVLQGSIEIKGTCHTETLGSHTLAVIDKNKIRTCTCTAGTHLLEFMPPKRIDRFFGSAARAFGTLASEHIAYNADIDEWIEQIRSDCLQGIRPDEYKYCCRLREILRQYPDIVLGTLVIPLHACALTSNKCLECGKRGSVGGIVRS